MRELTKNLLIFAINIEQAGFIFSAHCGISFAEILKHNVKTNHINL